MIDFENAAHYLKLAREAYERGDKTELAASLALVRIALTEDEKTDSHPGGVGAGR